MVTKNEVMWSQVDNSFEEYAGAQVLMEDPYSTMLPEDLLLSAPELQPPFVAAPPPLGGAGGEGRGELQWRDDESTFDVAHVEEAPLLPVSPLGPPTRDNFSGPYNFQVEIDSTDTSKKKYVYSHQLNRIYVLMATGFPVQFKWDWEAAGRPLLVRATTVFSDVSMGEKRVERCLQHVHPTNNVSEDARHHVLQSMRAPGTAGVHYCGARAEPLSWFSVAVAFPARPDAAARRLVHAYAFHCKSTCSSGINRRPVEVLFTLEDLGGQVYGRQAVGARVCSCPRRDLKKDEAAAPLPAGKRRRAPAACPAAAPHAPAAAPPGKRVKREALEDDDDDEGDVYPMTLNLQFGGRRRSEHFLTTVLALLRAAQAETKSDRRYEMYAEQIQLVSAQLPQLRDGR